MHPNNASLTTSTQGRALITKFEGLYLEAYLCPAKVWTIGYGHTGLQHKDGTVYPGRVITAKVADELLAYDLHQFEARVKALVNVPLTQGQFDALVSFDFNTGALHRSTLLRLLNAGDYAKAGPQLLRWTRSDGQVLKGLVRRRQAELLRWNDATPQNL